jgi:hypothetical protein
MTYFKGCQGSNKVTFWHKKLVLKIIRQSQCKYFSTDFAVRSYLCFFRIGCFESKIENQNDFLDVLKLDIRNSEFIIRYFSLKHNNEYRVMNNE